MNNIDYNVFHKNSNIQNKIISKDNFTYKNLLKIINKEVLPNLNTFSKVLDLGCGVGTITFYLTSKINKIYVKGIDVSSRAIDFCNSSKKLLKANNCFFYCEDLSNNRESNKFDLILALDVIEHIFEEEKIVKQIFKIMQKNGLLIVSLPSSSNIFSSFGLLRKFDQRVGHYKRYNKKYFFDKFILTSKNIKLINTYCFDGPLRTILFCYKNPINNLIIKVLNKNYILSNMFNYLDNLLIAIFGNAQIVYLIKKI